MSKPREILKIGAIILSCGSVLLVKKKGAPSFILPGGKPELGETDLEALDREIREELGCFLDKESVRFIGEFEDKAADLSKTNVRVRLYSAELQGIPLAAAEIDYLEWVSPTSRSEKLAPSIRNSIFPYLIEKGYFEPQRDA